MKLILLFLLLAMLGGCVCHKKPIYDKGVYIVFNEAGEIIGCINCRAYRGGLTYKIIGQDLVRVDKEEGWKN